MRMQINKRKSIELMKNQVVRKDIDDQEVVMTESLS